MLKKFVKVERCNITQIKLQQNISLTHQFQWQIKNAIITIITKINPMSIPKHKSPQVHIIDMERNDTQGGFDPQTGNFEGNQSMTQIKSNNKIEEINQLENLEKINQVKPIKLRTTKNNHNRQTTQVRNQLTIINELQSSATQLNIDQNIFKQSDAPVQAPTAPIFPKKLIILVSFICLWMLAGVTFYLSFVLPPDKALQFSENKRTLLQRGYTENKVYYFQQLITTVKDDNDLRINYTLILAVQKQERNGTTFAAVLQKRSEKLYYASNGSMISEVYYDNSSLFYDLLRYGADKVASADANTTEPVNITDLQLQNTANDTDIVEASSTVLEVFQMVVSSTGKIVGFTFPKQMKKTTLGLLRCFAKMFSPVLIKQYYQKQQPISKVKVGSQYDRFTGRLLQQNDTNSTNSTSKIQQIYQESETHKYYSDDQSIVLTKVSSVNSSGLSHITQDISTQINVFTLAGEFDSASIESTTKFLSRPEEPKQQATTFDLGLEQTSIQRCEMKAKGNFIALERQVGVFGMFLEYYREKNETYNLDMQQMINYMMGKGTDQDNMEPGSSRLLLEKDGSLTLLDYEKQIDTLSTNILGFSVTSHGYIKTKLSIFEDAKNSLKKTVRLKTEVGEVYSLAFLRRKQPIFQHTHEQQPLSLLYTLQKIDQIINQLRPEFTNKVNQISNLILDGSFENNITPKIMNLLANIDSLLSALKQRQDALAPRVVINKILNSVTNIRNVINTKGLTRLAPQNQFATILYDQLSNYHKAAFAEALATFDRVKANLITIRNEGTTFLQSNAVSFIGPQTVQIKQKVYTLIPDDVFQEYKRQMQKAQPILDYLRFVKQNGITYATYVQNTLDTHEENFVKMTKNVIDLYFRNQTNITDTFVGIVNARFNTVVNQLASFDVLKERVDVPEMQRRSLRLFQQFLYQDLLDNQWKTDWLAKMQALMPLSRGVASQRGDCCHWQTSGGFMGMFTTRTCKRWNNAQGDQAAQPFWYDGFRQAGQFLFTDTSNQITNFVNQVKNMIINPDNDVVSKYNQLVFRIELYDSLIPDQIFQNLLKNIYDRRNAAINTRSKVGCGGTGNLDNYIVKLLQFAQYTNQYKDRYRQSVAQGRSILARFNTTIYTAIVDNTIIIPSVPEYFNIYKSYEDVTWELYRQVKYIAMNYNPRLFADSDQIARDVYRLYQLITESLDQLCIYRPQNQSTIVNIIRKQYERMWNYLKPMRNDFLSGELSRINVFLQYGSNNLYTSYLNIAFCANKAQFWTDIQTLFPDWKNFTIIYDLYDQMTAIQRQGYAQLKILRDQVATLHLKFFQLFSPKGYQDLVFYAQKLAQQFQDTNTNISLYLSNLRLKCNSLFMYTFARRAELEPGVAIFSATPYIQSADLMYIGIVDKVKACLDLIQQLSFDVIAFVVAAKEVIEYYDVTMGNYTLGMQEVKTNFDTLCGQFLALNTSVTQQYLNTIMAGLRAVGSQFPDTVFPGLKAKQNFIRDKYKEYVFRSNLLRQLFLNSMGRMQQFYNIAAQKQAYLDTRVNQYVNQSVKLLQSLQIASLNSMNQLADTIKSKFLEFYNNYTLRVNLLDGFKPMVEADFRKVFTFKDFFGEIQKYLEGNYTNFTQTVLGKFNQTEKSISQNVLFYAKFKNSTSYANLQKMKTQFFIQFGSLWNQAQRDMLNIQKYLQQINSDAAKILTNINDLKYKLTGLRTKITPKIDSLMAEYKYLRKLLYNIHELYFIDCISDMQNLVGATVQKLDSSVKGIVQSDFQPLYNLTSSPLFSQTPEISSAMSLTSTSFSGLQSASKLYNTNQQSILDKILKFIIHDLIRKFQKLIDGKQAIKSQTNAKAAHKQITLYHKRLAESTVPIEAASWPIPTPIGPFNVKIQIQFRYSGQLRVTLRDYRTIDVSVTFRVILLLEANFFYGISMIAEIGIFLRGTVLRAQLHPQLILKNVIPMQLVHDITGIKQVKKHNEGQAQFLVDLQLQLVVIKVGIYIKHIWIEIIWYQVKLCFSFWFFSFCFSFHIPIGFRLTYKTHEWGHEFPALAKIRKTIIKDVIARWGSDKK